MTPTHHKTISPDYPPEILKNMKLYKVTTVNTCWHFRAANAEHALGLAEDKIYHLEQQGYGSDAVCKVEGPLKEEVQNG